MLLRATIFALAAIATIATAALAPRGASAAQVGFSKRVYGDWNRCGYCDKPTESVSPTAPIRPRFWDSAGTHKLRSSWQ